MRAKDYRKAACSDLADKKRTFALMLFVESILMLALNGVSNGFISGPLARILFAFSDNEAAAVQAVFELVAFAFIVRMIVAGPFAVGFSKCCMTCSRGGEVRIENLFDGFKDFLRSFLLGLLNSIFICFWTMLLVVPGIIAELRYSMSYFILNDEPGISANEARKKSIAMMRGHKWQLFCLRLSYIGWLLLAVLTLGILMLWVYPRMRVAEARFYEDLKKSSSIEVV